MKRSIYISILVLILSLVGCTEMGLSRSSDLFTRDAATTGVWVGGRQVIVKNDNLHQESFRNKSYRLQTDDQKTYINIMLNTVPQNVGDKCTVTIVSRGIDEIQDSALDMILQKTEDDMIWLWNESEKMGIVMVCDKVY